MNKQLFSALLTSLVMAGFASAQTQTTSATPAATSASMTECCKEKCTKTNNVCLKKNDVLTKEERHRFCCAKEAALAANPSLVGQKGLAAKHALCADILKADPSMQPIMEKLKKHWMETHKNCKQSACETTEAGATAAQK